MKSYRSVAGISVIFGLSACAGSDLYQTEAAVAGVVPNRPPVSVALTTESPRGLEASARSARVPAKLHSKAIRGQDDIAQFGSPNFYKLSGGGISISYYPTITPGLTQFTYQDPERRLQFIYNQIRTVEVPDVGTIVSVTLELTVDAGSTTFSVLLPDVNLAAQPDASAKIATEGITTRHKFSLVPSFDKGQRELYTVTPLCGTASSVIVPL